MSLDFNTLTPQIERVINRLQWEYSRTPALILTEDDLKCRLHMKLDRLAALRRRMPTRDVHILGSSVHAELSWYDEHQRLRIRPDLTITEPEGLCIQPSYATAMLDPFAGASSFGISRGQPRLPSKQYEFDGNAINFELKFAREGITKSMMRLIRQDFAKMQRIFDIMDGRGQGDSVFSFLVIFNKLPQEWQDTPLDKFMLKHGIGPRHKILYKRCIPYRSLPLATSDAYRRRMFIGSPPCSRRPPKQ